MSPGSESSVDELALAKGASLGRYVVLGLLGRGGMGEVYAAYDPELDRKIAVKLLRGRTGGADGGTRLLREAQAIARLSHPNVVVVYDVGTFQESVFIAMEFVEGNTLGYWLTAAARGWREVLEVYLAAGRGLAAAHAAGLVHRDFKPENVMLTKGGQVRVMDFGLARVQSGAAGEPAREDPAERAARAVALATTLADISDDRTFKIGGGGRTDTKTNGGAGQYLGLKLTQTGAILGTPAYMAPEQFAGVGGDARSDQFAFCVALYEGLYGRRPFAGDNAVALMANVVTGTITDPPPETRVPAWIRRVLLTGLATKPADRFPSMTELLAALGHDPAARRRRLLATAGGALAIAALAAGAVHLTSGARALCAGGPGRAEAVWGAPQRGAIEGAFKGSGNRRAGAVFASVGGLFDQYVARWIGMYKETCEATQVRGEQSTEVLDLRMSCLGERLASLRALGDVLATADKSIVDNAVGAASALPTLDRCADVAMLRAVIKPPDDPAKRAEVAKLGEQTAKLTALSSAGRCNDAKTIGGPLLDRARGLGYRPLEAEAALGLGRLADSCVEPAVATEYLEEAVLSAEASDDDEVAIRASSFLSVLESDRLGNPSLGRYWVRHADALLARFPSHPLLAADVASARSIWLGAEGHDEEALSEERRALDLREHAKGPTNIETADTLLNIMVRLHTLGRDAEAVSVGERARDLYAKLAGDDSGQMALAMLDLSESLIALRRFDQAQAAVARAIEIWKGNGVPFYVGYGLLDQGRLEVAEERAKEAVADLDRAVTMLGDTDAGAEAKFELARALWSQPRDHRRALALATAAESAFGKAPSEARNLKQVHSWLESRRGP